MRRLLTLAVGLMPLLSPLPGGGSGRPEARPPAQARFHSKVTLLDAPSPDAPLDPPPAFPRFLKRKALAFLPAGAQTTPVAAADAHELLLTFDDGPDLQTTPLVLEELDRRGLKAVFFVNGKGLMGSRPADRARRHLLRKLAAHGHFVGNHSLTHKKLCLEPATIPQEIDGNAEIITAATGVYPRLFRSPYGGTCQALETALAERGMINVGWNIDPQEWRGDEADTIVPVVLAQLERLEGRGILLLHDTHRSTPRALPRILDWIEAANRHREGERTPGASTKPFRIVDYTVLLPARPLPLTGVEATLAASLEGLTSLTWQTPGASLAAGP